MTLPEPARRFLRPLPLGGIAFAIWLLCAYGLFGLFALPLPDGAQYLMPAVVARHPLNLTLPMVGDFEGFDHAWGLQCFGSPALSTLLLGGIPWSYAGQPLISLLLTALNAAVLAWFVRRVTGNGWLALCGFLLLLGNYTVMVFIGMAVRPEIWCTPLLVFLVACLGQNLAGSRLSPAGLAGGFAACLLLATLHPYAIGLVAGLLALTGALQVWQRHKLGTVAALATGFALGGACLVLWFALQPDARAQFQENAALQSTFNFSRFSFLTHPHLQRLGAEYPWWMAGLAAALQITVGLATRRFRKASAVEWMLFLSGAVVAGVLSLDFILGMKNFCYTALALPFAVTLALAAFGRLHQGCPASRKPLLAGTLVLLLAWYWIWLPGRFLRWKAEGFANVPRSLTAFVESLPAARRIFIPSSLWEAVLGRDLTRYRFFTFPLPLGDASRRKYESATLAEARPGDLLVVDVAMMKYDEFHSNPLMPVDPPDPEKWDFVRRDARYFHGGIVWGWDFLLYRRKDPSGAPAL